MRTIRKLLVLIILAMSLAGSGAVAAKIDVTVTIKSITNISAGDSFGDLPDFYARIDIAGQPYRTQTFYDAAKVIGDLKFTANVSTRMLGNLVPIRIEIWDLDPAQIGQGGDDLVDVDPDECAVAGPLGGFGCAFLTDRPGADTRGLDLTLDLTTGAWKGYSSSPTADAAGSGTTETCTAGTESESARVCFTITVGPQLVIPVGGLTYVPEELVVTKPEDTNNGRCKLYDCSLREAVNAAWPGETVWVPDLGTPYRLTYSRVSFVPPDPGDEPGHLKITKKLKVCGRDGDRGPVILQTLADTRVFDIHGGAEVEICNLTVMGGTAGPTSTAADTHLHGGGIHNHGNVTLRNVTISNNSAPYTSIGGGGGFYNANEARLINVTITQNTANGGAGGIESNPSSKTNLKNTLIANNTGIPLSGNPLPGNCNPAHLNAAGDLLNGFFNEGGNLQFPDATCGTAIPTAPTPPIGAPSTNGTYPLAGPGIDGGTDIGCPPKDQLGLPRPIDGNKDGNPVCDVGAREMPAGITLPQGPPGLGTTFSLPRSPHPAH
jgi:CSLREA domain-containing protein